MIITDEELKTLTLKNSLITKTGLMELEDYIKNTGSNIYDALIERNIASDEKLGIMISDYLKLPFVVLAKISIPTDVYKIIPERLARKQKIISFGLDEKGLKVAMTNPKNQLVLDAIAKKTGLKIITYMATERDLVGTFHIYQKDLQKTFNSLIGDSTITPIKEIPIAKMVDLIFAYALQDRSSDIHIEPQDKETVVRFRMDGMLQDIFKLPVKLHDRIITRIKVLSRLRTDEHLAAQDGKMRFDTDEETVDIRVSIIPIVDGEKAVLRLLSTHDRQFSLADLGMSNEDLEKLTAGMKKSYGMILSTGPTGSGKSTSIYSILKILNRREKNITTIEDPVEYRIKGVNQINVNPKTGLTFANGLRSILRQDPNIIFVGEIRDMETAGIAVNAALTGHLVVSTLHTNDAATALPRLIDMKVEPFLVASTINIIIAQRLVRKICEMCKTSTSITYEELNKNFPKETVQKHFASAKQCQVYYGKGCKICHLTGFSGRIGVFETLKMSDAIKKLIIEKSDADDIVRQAISEGMNTMLDDGLEKAKKGLTTIEEVLRVTKVESA
ncbi:type II/IV secretion system protein [Candidatus Roizmanbacteria bacterium]|nr:type II/IV secretion system protein [Candidatus Roizmanbacteria bacterium]